MVVNYLLLGSLLLPFLVDRFNQAATVSLLLFLNGNGLPNFELLITDALFIRLILQVAAAFVKCRYLIPAAGLVGSFKLIMRVAFKAASVLIIKLLLVMVVVVIVEIRSSILIDDG